MKRNEEEDCAQVFGEGRLSRRRFEQGIAYQRIISDQKTKRSCKRVKKRRRWPGGKNPAVKKRVRRVSPEEVCEQKGRKQITTQGDQRIKRRARKGKMEEWADPVTKRREYLGHKATGRTS